MKKSTWIISGFPGIGKTYYFEHNGNVLDSDSSTFDKRDFPENYIRHIKSNLGKVDIIFVSSHKSVRDALVDANLPFTLVFPRIENKGIYLERYRMRGSSDDFIVFLNKNWDDFIHQMESQKGCDFIRLNGAETISSIIVTKKIQKMEM